ncbi:MAG: cell morphology protein [Verrucomicrobiales bacterium]|nr:cell morphology protein [Verrucomicrobiales bacterium]
MPRRLPASSVLSDSPVRPGGPAAPSAFRPFHAPASIALALAFTAFLPACKSPGIKFPKLKFKNKSAATETADPAKPSPDAATTTNAAQPVPERSAAETAFLEKCAALGANGGTIAGRDGWNFSATELQRLSQIQDPNAPSLRAATSAITEYSNALKAKGTTLIFLPIPPKAILFPDKLDKDLKIKVRRKKPERLDSTLQAFYANLRAKGVQVIDVTDDLLAKRESRKEGPIFPQTAAVWSPRGAETAADSIARTLKGEKWANNPGKDGPLITENGILSYSGPLLPAPAKPETLAIRNIGRAADGKMRSVTFSQGGHPLALMGDSSLLAWRAANNPIGSAGAFASLADQLAFELQTTPDLYPGSTEGRNAPRQRILREATNGKNPLSSTKVLIWAVPATDLALSDWKRVPLKLDFSGSGGSSGTPTMLDAPVNLIPDPGASRPATPPPSPDPAPAPAPETAPTADPAAPPLPR